MVDFIKIHKHIPRYTKFPSAAELPCPAYGLGAKEKIIICSSAYIWFGGTAPKYKSAYQNYEAVCRAWPKTLFEEPSSRMLSSNRVLGRARQTA